MLRVVFMGTPEFSLPFLEELLSSKHQIAAVITQPDRPSGRNLKIVSSPVKQLAEENGLKILQPEELLSSQAKEEILNLNFDVGVVVAYGKLVPKWLLDTPPLGVINVHPSLLPKYRGAAPIPQAIIDGCQTTGVTIQKMSEELDRGDIILQKEVPIDEKETAGSLEEKLALAGKKLLAQALDDLEKGQATFVKQDESQATHAPKVEKEKALIDWLSSAYRIERLVRAFNPRPGVHTIYKKKRLKVWQADVEQQLAKVAGQEGRIVGFANQMPVVATGDGLLILVEVQSEGKSKMKADAFTRGHRVKISEKLG